MKLISCVHCGAVLDADKIACPEDIYDDDFVPDMTKAVWLDREYVPAVWCPVCHKKISHADGDSDEA